MNGSSGGSLYAIGPIDTYNPRTGCLGWEGETYYFDSFDLGVSKAESVSEGDYALIDPIKFEVRVLCVCEENNFMEMDTGIICLECDSRYEILSS